MKKLLRFEIWFDFLIAVIAILLGGIIGLRILKIETWSQSGAVFSYITPWVLLFLCCLTLFLVCCFRKEKSNTIVLGVLLFLSSVFWLKENVRSSVPISTPENGHSIRLVFWNADHYQRGKKPFYSPIKKLADLEADIYALAESDASRGPQKEMFAKLLPEHQYNFLLADMTIAFRCFQQKKRYIKWFNGWQSYAVIVELESDEGSLQIVFFDQHSDFKSRRAKNISKLTNFLDTLSSDAPIILVGDFNTPAGSEDFHTLRDAGWKRAFEDHGKGMGETWPTPLPVLSLDQCWTRDGVAVLQAKQKTIETLGHQALIIDLVYFSNSVENIE